MFLKNKVRYLRKFKCSLPSLTKKKVGEKKNRPGEHPFFFPKRTSVKKSFSDRLSDKQKLKLIFCLTERQLKNYIKFVLYYMKDNPILALYNLLHSRFDYIIYSLHFAKTILQARQFINHGQFFINNKKEKNPSYSCKIEDYIMTKSDLAMENFRQYLIGRVFFHAEFHDNKQNIVVKMQKPEYVNIKVLKLIRSSFEFYL